MPFANCVSRGLRTDGILTIALAVGAVTAVFSVVNAVLLRPYPFRDPDRIVCLAREYSGNPEYCSALARQLPALSKSQNARQFNQDAAIIQNPPFSVSTGIDHPQMTEGLAVSPNFFSVLGVPPFLGRPFARRKHRAEKTE